ncbi:MAG TPA: hypothetical protein ENK57_04610 [Polyangiaceae bacterium]|nr:hypothetical protein [Polyangiaceae bacterium]
MIGAGVAGLAATWAAAQRGAKLRLFDGGLGASCLAGGAVDDRPWDEVARSVEVLDAPPLAKPLPESVRIFASDLELWRLPHPGEPLARLATASGRIRVARGHDRSLLDLSRLRRGATVLLPIVPRAEWDAPSLARAFAADAYAVSRDLRFITADAKLLKLRGEDRIAPGDLASRHDDPDRRRWLVDRLEELLDRAGPVDALLLGPWLGALEPIAPVLEAELGVLVGEVLGGVGGAAGLRFEAARAALLATTGVSIEPHNVTRIRAGDVGDELVVSLDDDEEVVADAVVVACGGLAAGGVIYEPPEHRAGMDMPEAGAAPWRLSIDAPLQMQGHGRRLDVVGSVHGPALDHVGWPTDADPGLLESVGIRTAGTAAVLLESAGFEARLLAAGDVVADRPRTMLQAAFDGIRAGADAAGEPGALSA